MDTIEKLTVLSSDSQYDLACACGTKDEDRRKRGEEGRWLYPVSLPQGGYTVLLKTLLSNACSNDCKYCPLRAERDIRRCTLKPEETARLFMDYHRRKKVFGLFLSSAVTGSPDYTMERLNATARLLRERHEFRGYIHIKIIPGASDAAIEDALSLSTAVSLNIETPGKKHFDLLSRKKDYESDIIRPLKLLSKLTSKGMRREKVKCTSQFVVGASDEKDSEIVDYMFGLYDRLNFDRVYFSAYQKGLGSPDIPGEAGERRPEDVFMREHRLYQADFLLRKYGFKKGDMLFEKGGNLSLENDPKQVWADANPEFYPVKINSSDKSDLLKVPGIGPETAGRILRQRREGTIRRPEELGVKGKRLGQIRKYVIFE